MVLLRAGRRCAVAGCEREHHSRGLCQSHYDRNRQGGGLAEGDPRHGTRSAYTKLGCRCDRCREAKVSYDRSRRKGLRPGDERHGTRSGYMDHGCRCDSCRDAYMAYFRRNAGTLDPDDDRHGTLSGYAYFSCRCKRCRSAWSDHIRPFRYARKPVPGDQPYRASDIFRRDGHRCHLCGKKCRRNASHMHPLAPTVDHILPRSKGGADAPANVATAHRLCNTRKGAKLIGQPLLFG